MDHCEICGCRVMDMRPAGSVVTAAEAREHSKAAGFGGYDLCWTCMDGIAEQAIGSDSEGRRGTCSAHRCGAGATHAARSGAYRGLPLCAEHHECPSLPPPLPSCARSTPRPW